MSSATQVSAGGGAGQGSLSGGLVNAESTNGLPSAGSRNSNFILGVAGALASNPEFGPFLQRGLQSQNPLDLRAGWAATLKQYHLLLQQRAEERQSPPPYEQATLRMLGSLARGRTAQDVAPWMVKDGLITDVEQVNEIWATLGDSLATFVSPGFWERPDNRKKVELARLNEAFTKQSPQVAVRAILRLGRAPTEDIEAVCQFFDEKATAQSGTIPLGKGLVRFGEMCRDAYASTLAITPEVESMRRGPSPSQRLGQERAVFERLIGTRDSGLQRPRSYADFLSRSPMPSDELRDVVKQGLLRVLRFYVYKHGFDVAKLMAAIGLEPLESQPVVEVEPVPLVLATAAQKRALACMAIGAAQAEQPQPSSDHEPEELDL